MLLYLAKEGIFPITRDRDGRLLEAMPASGLSVPGTIQGEGKWGGMPALFVRLAGCNLRCAWKTAGGETRECDTVHAAYRVEGAYRVEVEEAARIIRHNRGETDHVVITGGEPFLQAEGVAALCRRLREENERVYITVETNATIHDEACAREVDFFSMSPKLSGSVALSTRGDGSEPTRLNREVIQAFISGARERGKDFQLKFVYSREEDIEEIKALLAGLKGWRKEDVLLMPMGATPGELKLTAPGTLEHCIRNGWRYCDRLHIALFGAKQGV